MGAEHSLGEPGGDIAARQRPPIEGGRVRVVEVMATGTNGGAQEHVYSLVTRLDPANYDVRVVSLSHGSSVRRLEKAGIEVSVIDEPDDRTAVRALADLLASMEPEAIHNHMYRAEVVGTRAALLLGEMGCKRPAIISTVHSSRTRCAAAGRGGDEAPALLLVRQFEPHPLRRRPGGASPPDAADRPPDRRIQGHRAQDSGGRPHGRAGQSDLQRRGLAALQPPAAVLHAPR